VLSSWVPGADGSGFPAEHLPYGVFSVRGDKPRVGVRVGDTVLDLARLAADGAGGLDDASAGTFARPSLNAFASG
jgi:fumarylacetoacetase